MFCEPFTFSVRCDEKYIYYFLLCLVPGEEKVSEQSWGSFMAESGFAMVVLN